MSAFALRMIIGAVFSVCFVGLWMALDSAQSDLHVERIAHNATRKELVDMTEQRDSALRGLAVQNATIHALSARANACEQRRAEDAGRFNEMTAIFDAAQERERPATTTTIKEMDDATVRRLADFINGSL